VATIHYCPFENPAQTTIISGTSGDAAAAIIDINRRSAEIGKPEPSCTDGFRQIYDRVSHHCSQENPQEASFLC